MSEPISDLIILFAGTGLIFIIGMWTGRASAK